MRCDAVAALTEAIRKSGTMVQSPNGYPVQLPYIAIANRQAEIMLRLRIASEFGFTPASRSRIAAPSPAEPSLFDTSALPPLATFERPYRHFAFVPCADSTI
jgi:P27 family predicted phage terminase small subunit